MKNEEIVLKLLEESEAIQTGHFLLSSGRHSNKYIQCAKLTMYPNKASIIANIIKEKLKDIKIDAVVGPAMGGIIISYEVARSLGVSSMFTERVNDLMTLRRGFIVNQGDNILIVEDVVTTGKSSLETIKVLKELGANIVGIASIIDRRTKDIKLEYPLYSAIKLDVESYNFKECKLCEENKEELVKPGSRKKFD